MRTRTIIVDPIEDQLGISTYLLQSKSNNGDNSDNCNNENDETMDDDSKRCKIPHSCGFSAISKARFSDFIVHEVGMDGSIAYLTSMEPNVIQTQLPQTTTTTTTTTTTDPVVNTTSVSIPPESSLPYDMNIKEDPSTGSKKRKIDATIDTTSSEKDDLVRSPANPSLDWTTLEEEFTSIIQNAVAAKEVMQFLQQHQQLSSSVLSNEQRKLDTTITKENPTNETEQVIEGQPKSPEVRQQYYIALPPCPEKVMRKQIHSWIQTNISSVAVADTIDNGIIRIWKVQYRQYMPNKIDKFHHRNNNNNNRNNNNNKHSRSTDTITSGQQQQSNARDFPYLQFVLYKENMDTGLAIQMISKRANSFGGGNSNRNGGKYNNNSKRPIRMGYAGNKDKRGITCQYITIPARDTSIKHLCNVFNKATTTNDNNYNTGSGHTNNGGSSMIRLGNFQYVKEELRLGRLRGNRFTIALRNIRIDNDDGTTTITANYRSILHQSVQQLERGGFINYFGTQRFGKYHNTHITGLAVLRGDYQTAIDTIICPPQVDNHNDDDGDDVTTNRRETAKTTPKQIHDDSIQKAQVQWRDRFLNLKNDMNSDEKKAFEQNIAKQTLSVMNHYMQSEIAILQSLIRFPLDYERAFNCITKTMRMMFIHAVQSLLWNKCATYRIDTMGHQVVVGDLVLAVPSIEEMDSNDTSHGCPEVYVVTESDIVEGKYKLDEIVLPLIGIKTRNPNNASGDYIATLFQQYNIRMELFEQMQQQRDFHCAGDYRKVICRPKDVKYEIIEYTDPLQPLIQTDYMKLSNIPVPHNLNDNKTNQPNNSIVGIKSLDDNNGEQTDGKEDPVALIGMVIHFTLTSSSYATICLRELMQRPTISEYQRDYNCNDKDRPIDLFCYFFKKYKY